MNSLELQKFLEVNIEVEYCNEKLFFDNVKEFTKFINEKADLLFFEKNIDVLKNTSFGEAGEFDTAECSFFDYYLLECEIKIEIVKFLVEKFGLKGTTYAYNPVDYYMIRKLDIEILKLLVNENNSYLICNIFKNEFTKNDEKVKIFEFLLEFTNPKFDSNNYLAKSGYLSIFEMVQNMKNIDFDSFKTVFEILRDKNVKINFEFVLNALTNIEFLCGDNLGKIIEYCYLNLTDEQKTDNKIQERLFYLSKKNEYFKNFAKENNINLNESENRKKFYFKEW